MSVNSPVSSHYGESVYGNMHTLNNSSFQHQIEVHQSEELEKQPSAQQNSTQNEALNFEFGVHLAEGSKRCYVSNFASMVELYEKIAQCFDISPKEIMYCTLNTEKVDMDRILGGQIGLEDTIYVHRKGARKDVEVTKSERFLGLTIADNSNGISYIKKIKEDSTASRVPFIKVGDHIEAIMDENMVGCRHYEVARFLKSIPLNEIFRITLIEPKSSGYISDIIKPIHHHQARTIPFALGEEVNNSNNNGKNFGTGTLRIKGNLGNILSTFQDENSPEASAFSEEQMSLVIALINKQLEKFIGINDDELAEELWRMAVAKNPHQFALRVADSELNNFKFNQTFLFDVWAIVNDVISGRIQSCK